MSANTVQQSSSTAVWYVHMNIYLKVCYTAALSDCVACLHFRKFFH